MSDVKDQNKSLDFTHQNTLNSNFQKEANFSVTTLKLEDPCVSIYKICKNVNPPQLYHNHKVNCLDMYAKCIQSQTTIKH